MGRLGIDLELEGTSPRLEMGKNMPKWSPGCALVESLTPTRRKSGFGAIPRRLLMQACSQLPDDYPPDHLKRFGNQERLEGRPPHVWPYPACRPDGGRSLCGRGEAVQVFESVHTPSTCEMTSPAFEVPRKGAGRASFAWFVAAQIVCILVLPFFVFETFIQLSSVNPNLFL